MKNKAGISLILLVITIIVIIILAGAVILSLSNNNPIQQSNEAAFKSNVDTYNSELTLALSNMYVQNTSFNPDTFYAGTWDGTNPSIPGTIKEYITSITIIDGPKFEIQKGKLVYVGIDQTEKNWTTQMGIVNTIPSPGPPLGVNVIATVNSTVDGTVPVYTNPIIPKGFKAVNDTAVWPTDWNSGLVIEDGSGNQFVWVPVDGTNVPYAKWCTTGISYNHASISDDTLPSGVVNETEQITKYGGFYIARYEAGKEGASTLVSKKTIAVWNNINYTDAKIAAEAMYTVPEVKSGLVTGSQWDTVVKWLQNSGKNVGNSVTWGNHINSAAPANVAGFGSLQVTGHSEFWKANSIYDLAGNAWEWTNEIYDTNRVPRGGVYDSSGVVFPVSYRYNTVPTANTTNIGFRAVLYIL